MTTKDQTENERRLDELEEHKPQPFTVKRLAHAIAIANGHSHPEEFATKVADAWKTLAPDDTTAAIREARADRAKE